MHKSDTVRTRSVMPTSQSRPGFSPGYGIVAGAEGMLAWDDVVRRLEASRNYWISTTNPDGRPHAAPVWGVWLEGALFFGTEPASRKGRNLAANPATALHLESGDDVVILEGEAQPETDVSLVQRASHTYKEKYGLGLLADEMPPSTILAFRPRVAFAWREQDFPRTATRWTFGLLR